MDKMKEIITRCPECGGPGQVLYRRRGIVTVECFNCESRWNSLTEICPVCEEPNGYIVPGLCKRCYAEYRFANDLNLAEEVEEL